MNYHIEILECFYKLKNMHFTKLLPMELTHGECFALMKLGRLEQTQENVTVSDLAGKLSVSVPALSRTIKNLEKRGYVTRTTDPADRRNHFLKVAPEGDKIVEKIDHRMKIYCGKIYGRIGEERVEEFIRFLNDLYDVTSEEIQKNESWE